MEYFAFNPHNKVQIAFNLLPVTTPKIENYESKGKDKKKKKKNTHHCKLNIHSSFLSESKINTSYNTNITIHYLPLVVVNCYIFWD